MTGDHRSTHGGRAGGRGARAFVDEGRRSPVEELAPDIHASIGSGGAPAEAVRAPGLPTAIEPPSVPEGTFVKVRDGEHPLPRACEVAVYFQDYHRSSTKLGRFGKVVGVDDAGGEYLIMLDNFECVSVPMRRVEWRKMAT